MLLGVRIINQQTKCIVLFADISRLVL